MERKCKADNKRADISARITVNGDVTEMAIKEQVKASDCNSGKETVKGTTIQSKTVNERIESIRFKIREKYRELEEREVLLTADSVKAAYLGIQSIQKGHKLLELMEFYKKIWEPKQKNGGFKNYRTTIDYLKRFLKDNYQGGDVFLSQLSMQVATEFEHYIRHNPLKEHDPCAGNGVVKHIQRFKRLVNWAVVIEWIKVNPFEKYNCPLKRNVRKKLTIQELVALEEKQISNETLCYVRDLFVYCCYAGLAYADVMALKKSHFEREPGGAVWCLIYRAKSDELCRIPLLKKAASILGTYNEYHDLNPNCNVFRPIPNQVVNRNLKLLREICDIETPMTFHITRHTFAKTVALKNGVPLETVQIMMGHTKITTTQIYAQVDEEKILDDIAGIEDRLQMKKDMIISGENQGGVFLLPGNSVAFVS